MSFCMPGSGSTRIFMEDMSKGGGLIWRDQNMKIGLKIVTFGMNDISSTTDSGQWCSQTLTNERVMGKRGSAILEGDWN